MGELIAVLSGKGGTGKTSVCACISTALAMAGSKVLCIDCDIGLRNLDISLGISELGALSFTDVSQGSYSLDQATVHPKYPSLSFLTAPMNCGADKIDQASFACTPALKIILKPKEMKIDDDVFAQDTALDKYGFWD